MNPEDQIWIEKNQIVVESIQEILKNKDLYDCFVILGTLSCCVLNQMKKKLDLKEIDLLIETATKEFSRVRNEK